MPIRNKQTILTAGFDEDALFSFADSETIVNMGQLETSGDLAEGIFSVGDRVRIENHGDIVTLGDGAAGIIGIGAGVQIVNHASVETSGDPLDDFFSDGIAVYGENGRIDNHGSVSVHGIAAGSLAAYGAGHSVNNHGVAESTGWFGAAVAIFGAFNKISNYGTAIGSGPQTATLLIVGESSSATNHGLIRSLGGTYSEAMRAVGLGNSLLNRGRIEVDGAIYSTGMLVIGADSSVVNAGTITVVNEYAFAMGAPGFGGTGIRQSLTNLGAIVTSGDHGVGILHGAPRFDDIPDPPHGGRLWDQTDQGHVGNSGTIRTTGDGAAGIVAWMTTGTIENGGLIETWGALSVNGPVGPQSASGIIATGESIYVTNLATGRIVVHDLATAAVQLNVVDGWTPDDGYLATFVNRGLVSAPALAVAGGDADESVLNFGRLIGDVDLGAGADIFVAGRRGVLDGTLRLGDGDDQVLVERGAGRIVIGDFQAGAGSDDRVNLAAFGFGNAGAVLAKATQSGADVVIALARGDTLVLQGVLLGQLHADDFDLAPWTGPVG